MPFNLNDSIDPTNAPANLIGQVNALASQVKKIIGGNSWKENPGGSLNQVIFQQNLFVPLMMDYLSSLKPKVAISSRLLRAPLYKSTILKVRRDSDNDLVEILPDLSLPIPAASINSRIANSNTKLIDFIGSSKPYVHTLKNQSHPEDGVGDLVQEMPSKQPELIIRGDFFEPNKQPTLLFDGIDDNLFINSNCGIDRTTGFTILEKSYKPVNRRGAISKIGNYIGYTGDGIGIGFGDDSVDSVGSNLVGLYEWISWIRPTTLNGTAIGETTSVIKSLTPNGTSVKFWSNNKTENINVSQFTNPSPLLQIGGYTGRYSNIFLSEILIFNSSVFDSLIEEIIANHIEWSN